MSHPSWFYTSGVSGGASDSAPGPRFYHAATRLDQGLLIFGGNNGNQYKNDLYLLETFDGVGDGADAKGVLSSNESSTFIQYGNGLTSLGCRVQGNGLTKKQPSLISWSGGQMLDST